MTAYSSTRDWTLVEPALRNALLSEGGLRELPRGCWPTWAESSTKFNRMWAVSGDVWRNFGTTSPSSSFHGALLTERIDEKDYPQKYNYDIYLIARTTDGWLYHSGPRKPFEPAHHSSSPSTWVEGLVQL